MAMHACTSVPANPSPLGHLVVKMCAFSSVCYLLPCNQAHKARPLTFTQLHFPPTYHDCLFHAATRGGPIKLRQLTSARP